MPNGIEVAQAYVTIIPSMKGIQGTIAKELDAERVGNDAGKKLGEGMAKSAEKAGSALTKSFSSVGDRIAFKTKTGLSTAFDNAAKSAKDKMSSAATTISSKFEAVGNRIKSTSVGSALAGIATGVGSAFTTVTATIRGTAQFASEAFTGISDRVHAAFAPIGEKLAPVFSKIGDMAKGAFDAVATAAKIGAGATAAAVTAITTASVQGYGEYEQLAGGMEKLFGDSAQTVIDNAQQAYLTAGKSANEYMEGVTSIAASLVNSVGGDTAEAARLADVAMRAMSDNVNTFGTDAEAVQNAIQGLAKGNFSMLDNLSLGFAGSQQGMVDLINASGVLDHKLEETSELADVGFGTMIEAIQKVQEDMNIAGTTVNEAMGTIEGSITATKSAWSNWVTELGKDNGDIEARTAELVDSVIAVGENVIPRAADIVARLGSEVPAAISKLAPKMGEAVTSLLDGVTNGAFSKAVSAIQPYIDRMGNTARGLFDRLAPLAPIVQEIGGKIGGILQTGVRLAADAFEWLAPIIATIAEHALPILSDVIGIVADAFSAAVTVMEPVGTFLSETLTAAIDWVGEKLEALVGWVSDAFGAIGDTAESVASFIKDPIGSITKSFTDSGKKTQKSAKETNKSVVKSYDSMERQAASSVTALSKTTTKNMNAAEKAVSDSTSKAATNAGKNMGTAATSITTQTGKAATSAEQNGKRIETAWNKTYTTKMNATASTGAAETTMANFKNKWTNFTVAGKASLDTSGANKTLSDWKYRNNNFVIQGSVQIRNNATVHTQGYMAAGGIIQKHADGFIANRPGRGVNITQHIAGEAGAEAVIPLTNRQYVAPFAKTVADFINKDGGGVTVTGNTFVVRRDSDISAIGRAINQEAERQRRAKL